MLSPDSPAKIRNKDGEFIARMDPRLEKTTVTAFDSIALVSSPSLDGCWILYYLNLFYMFIEDSSWVFMKLDEFLHDIPCTEPCRCMIRFRWWVDDCWLLCRLSAKDRASYFSPSANQTFQVHWFLRVGGSYCKYLFWRITGREN